MTKATDLYFLNIIHTTYNHTLVAISFFFFGNYILHYMYFLFKWNNNYNFSFLLDYYFFFSIEHIDKILWSFLI